jgi:glutamate dehydrogenase/leucine dehydrogenase
MNRGYATNGSGRGCVELQTPNARRYLDGVLTKKVVLVTGVARGCGRVLAEAFSAEGAKVVGCDTDTGWSEISKESNHD